MPIAWADVLPMMPVMSTAVFGVLWLSTVSASRPTARAVAARLLSSKNHFESQNSGNFVVEVLAAS